MDKPRRACKNLGMAHLMASPAHAPALRAAALAQRMPPHFYFVGSAIFHYLGPAFAVLLFTHVAPLGVAWLRIASAAVVFALWRRPWRYFFRQDGATRLNILALGVVLAVMNACFYLAIARLPLATVGAIEFLGPLGLAVVGLRTIRNCGALLLALVGVVLLTHVRIAGAPGAFALAFANCLLFALYIVLGHRLARNGGGEGIDRLGAAMLVAIIAVMPIGFRDATVAFGSPVLLGAGIGVGVTSSVIPYVLDQLAMARLQRATFALLLALLPAMATLIGIVVLHQMPKLVEALGIALVVIGVAVHREVHN